MESWNDKLGKSSLPKGHAPDAVFYPLLEKSTFNLGLPHFACSEEVLSRHSAASLRFLPELKLAVRSAVRLVGVAYGHCEYVSITSGRHDKVKHDLEFTC